LIRDQALSRLSSLGATQGTRQGQGEVSDSLQQLLDFAIVDSPLLQITLHHPPEAVPANGQYTAKDCDSSGSLSRQVALVADRLVASLGREISASRVRQGEMVSVSSDVDLKWGL
jgi:hypothetical protein